MTQTPQPALRLEDLAHYFGGDPLTRIHPTLVASAGAVHVFKAGGAFWLADLAWSILGKLDKADEDFAVLTLTTDTVERTASVIVHNGNDTELEEGEEARVVYHTQEIKYTDFPLEGEFTLWLELADDNPRTWTILLPKEH